MKTTDGRSFRLPLFTLTIVLVGSLAVAPSGAFCAWTIGKPMVTYFTGPGLGESQTDTTAQQIAAGGWNLVWVQSVSELNVAQSHGLRAMWMGAIDDATVTSIRSNPALYAYFVDDEPSASEFAGLASTVSRLRSLDPNRMVYINLHPTYADSSYLGVSDYRTYLNQFVSTVHPDLLSYDYYQFEVRADRPDYFKNLAVISHTAKQAGIPFINIVQSCSFASDMRVPTGNELRYLYNTSLAYGAQGVSDFVYYYPKFTGGMMNADGTTTELYTTAQTINPQFEAVAKQVQSLTHIGAYHLGDLPPGYDTTDGSSPLRLPTTSPFTVSGIATTPYQTFKAVRGAVVGLWGSNDEIAHATYAYVVNLNYSDTLTTRITGPGDLSIFDPKTGIWTAKHQAWGDVTLEPGGGVLVGLTATIPESSGPYGVHQRRNRAAGWNGGKERSKLTSRRWVPTAMTHLGTP